MDPPRTFARPCSPLGAALLSTRVDLTIGTCRIGSTRGAEVIDRLVAGQDRKKQEALLRDLCDTMTSASLCAMGGLTPLPVLSALDHFPEDFAKV